MKKFAISICLLLSLIVTACSVGTEDEASGSGESISISGPGMDLFDDDAKWVDSDLYGSVTADRDVRLQDDYAAAVNRDWKLAIGDQYSGALDEAGNTIREQKQQIMDDPSIGGATGDVLREYYRLASGWEGRNTDGVEPLRPYIEDIAGISGMEDLYAFSGDIKRNPLRLAPVTTSLVMMDKSALHPKEYAIAAWAPRLSLSWQNDDNSLYFNLNSADALEAYEKVENKALYVLKKLGYSEREASALFKECLSWERAVAAANNTESAEKTEDITYDRHTAFAYAGNYPLQEQLAAWGMDGTNDIMILPGYAKKLDSLCRAGNLEKIKAYLIVNYCLQSATRLDRETYDKVEEFEKPRSYELIDYGKSPEQEESELIFNGYIAASPMVGAMDKVYVENFFDEACMDDLNALTDDLIEHFRTLFNKEEWMSEEGRAACIKKLDAITKHIVYPDFDSVDYGKLDIKSRDEGGSFLEAYFESLRFENEHMAWLAHQPYDRDYWDPMLQATSTTITNAMYRPVTNGIYIFAGVCVAPIYTPDISYEEKLGGIFAIVGHEITHGFDGNGVLYDLNGEKKDWLPYEDQMTFADRNDKVGQYYTTLTPFPGSGLYDGSNVKGEATADMGGLKATLMMAADHSGFDYDRYFRAFATLWRENVPIEEEKEMIKDVHPLPFCRVNVGVQQFDEFYATYDVEEDDNMYLAPEKRIKVW